MSMLRPVFGVHFQGKERGGDKRRLQEFQVEVPLALRFKACIDRPAWGCTSGYSAQLLFSL
jgi:hypothetical protein